MCVECGNLLVDVGPRCRSCAGPMPARVYEYAIDYTTHIVYDRHWACVADVVATFHNTTYVDHDRRVTGSLLRRWQGTQHWQPA